VFKNVIAPKNAKTGEVRRKSFHCIDRKNPFPAWIRENAFKRWSDATVVTPLPNASILERWTMNFFGHDHLSGFRRIDRIGAYPTTAWADQESFHLKDAFLWSWHKVCDIIIAVLDPVVFGVSTIRYPLNRP